MSVWRSASSPSGPRESTTARSARTAAAPPTYDYLEGGCRQVKDVELTANLGWGTPWTGSALVLRRD